MEAGTTRPERRAYTREYKLEAVRLATEGGVSVAQVARDLGLNENLLHKWRRRFRADAQDAFPGKGHMRSLEEENRRLRRENVLLRQERDFLRKAAVWLAQHAH